MKQIIFSVLFLTWVHAEHNYTNVLVNSTSPYLQQHAHNPVNWYPWSKATLQKAKKRE